MTGPTEEQRDQSSAQAEPTSYGRRLLVNTGSLTGSSLWRIFISFVLQVLITRRLGVAEFGQYISVLAYLNVSQIVSELGLPTLLVRDLAQYPAQRRAYYFLALRIQLLASFGVWLGLALLTWILPFSTTTQQALWLVGASLPLYAVTSASQTLFKANERMELVMGVEGVINTLILLLSVAALWRGQGILALVGVLVLTQAISALFCIALLVRYRLLGRGEAVGSGWRRLWQDARPFYWISLADVLLHRLDILLLNIVTGDLVTGIYSIAYSVVRIMLKLIQSYWQALYPTLSRLHHRVQSQYQRLSSLSLRYGLLLVLPATAIGFGLAPGMLLTIYGESARASIPVLRLLIWAAPPFLVEMYAVTQLMACGRPKLSLRVIWVHIGVVLILLPVLTRSAGAMGAAVAFTSASWAGATWGVLALQRLGAPWRVERMGWLLTATAVAMVAAIWLPGGWVWRAGISGFVYLLIIWRSGVFAPCDRHMLRTALQRRGETASL